MNTNTNIIDLSLIPYNVLIEEVKRRREIDFYTRIDAINTAINELLEMKCPIIDIDNDEYRLQNIFYNKEDDLIYFGTKVMKQ